MTPGPDSGVPFTDRVEAGAALAARLVELPLLDPDPVVVALPRGGVPVGAVVADTIDAPLDVIIVRKLGVPGQPELAMGAIGEGGCACSTARSSPRLGIPSRISMRSNARERDRVGPTSESTPHRPSALFGAATGRSCSSTTAWQPGARRAPRSRSCRPRGRRVVLAVPVAPKDTVTRAAPVADAVVCVASPEPFRAIGQWYRDFRPTTDDEVVRLLHHRCERDRRVARRRRRPGPPAVGGSLPVAPPANAATVALVDARSAARS